MQVFWKSVNVSILAGCLIALVVFVPQIMREDLYAAFSYRKAVLAEGFDDAIAPFKQGTHVMLIDAKTRHGVYARNILPRKLMSLKLFKEADKAVMELLSSMVQLALLAGLGSFFLIFLLWNRFGRSIKDDKKIKGGKVMADLEIDKVLRSLGMASDLRVGKMPLVKDSETGHFLICGATGSGKTNLIDNILPQVEKRGQPAIVVDQTGEMIAKYYDPARGDIIFNPLDSRGQIWDFWADCFDDSINYIGINTCLEKFAKILFGFNRKISSSHSDPFWENSAEIVFTACASYARNHKSNRMMLLQDVLSCWNIGKLSKALANTPASRYLDAPNRVTASSILSVMATSTRPIHYLQEPERGRSFSLRNHLKEIKQGSRAWLFLSTKPSRRELTLPLVSCLLELAVSLLMENGIQREQKLWFVLDELASLGKLPALNGLMAEGRKYGACVIAAMQSLNQLYDNYGGYAGSAIFGQFGTKFFFRNDEPQIAKMIVDMCGSELINKQQKNTSFGASDLRDGVSYTEQEKQKPLLEYSDIAALSVGQCYALLPEPKARLGKINVPESRQMKKNEGFIDHLACSSRELPKFEEECTNSAETENNEVLESNDQAEYISIVDKEEPELTK